MTTKNEAKRILDDVRARLDAAREKRANAWAMADKVAAAGDVPVYLLLQDIGFSFGGEVAKLEAEHADAYAAWREAEEDAPAVGMGATVCHWSDRTAGTIVYVSPSGNKIQVQEDTATRADHNGMSEYQEYTYAPNPNGTVYTATRRQDGTYRLVGSSPNHGRVLIGVRAQYRDYSF